MLIEIQSGECLNEAVRKWKWSESLDRSLIESEHSAICPIQAKQMFGWSINPLLDFYFLYVFFSFINDLSSCILQCITRKLNFSNYNLIQLSSCCYPINSQVHYGDLMYIVKMNNILNMIKIRHGIEGEIYLISMVTVDNCSDTCTNMSHCANNRGIIKVIKNFIDKFHR